MPVGFLLGVRIQDSSFTIRKALLVALMGCGISVTIEALQFFFMRGFSEVDDVMHNTVGCVIGWLMVKGSRFMVKGSWFRV